VLLNELAETLGPDLCHQFVTPEVICLSEDPVFRVRKATALNLVREHAAECCVRCLPLWCVPCMGSTVRGVSVRVLGRRGWGVESHHAWALWLLPGSHC
jgi:hypothetical protein